MAKLNYNLIKLLQNTSKWHLWLAAVILAMLLTLPIVSLMESLLLGKVTVDYVITGLVASIAVASVVSGLTIYFLQLVSRIRLDIDQLNAFTGACPVPIILNDDKNNILQINPEFNRVFGYALEDIPTLNDWWPNVCPDEAYRRSVIDQWRQQLQENRVQRAINKPLEVKLRCKNGVIKDVVVIDTHLTAPYEGIQLVALYDASERVAMANALTESRNILQSVIEMIPMRVFWKDRDSRYLGCNTAFAMDAGEADPASMIGKQDGQLPWKEQAELYRTDDQQVIQTKVPKLAFDEPQTTADGRRIWLRTSKVPLPDDRGNVIGVLGVYEDISDRKKIETDLWLTKTILDKSKTAFFRHSPDGMVQYVNEFACQSLGYTREELVGKFPWDFDPDFPSTAWPGFWEKLRRDGVVNMESRHRRIDGTVFNVEITAHYILHDGNEFNFVFVQDTTERKKIENALRQKEGYQRALLDNFPFMIWLKDKQSNFLAVNQFLSEALGEQDPNKLVGKSDFDYSPKEMAEGYQRDDRLVLASNQRKTVEEEHIDHLGVRRWLETFKAPVVDENGEQLGTVGFARDITERKKIEEELRIAAIAFESQEGMIITDSNSIILRINQAFTKMTGYTAEEAVGHKMNLLKSGRHDASFYAEMWKSIKQRGFWQGEVWNRRKNGNIYPEWLTITAVTDGGEKVTHYVGTMIDITVRKTVEEQIRHLAHHDVLTNLPNRTLLSDRLHQALAQARREKGMLALMFLDLDKFKPVNDELGHDVGDLLLKQVASRLQDCVKRESDTVSRLGGDEFVILLPLIEGEHAAAAVAEKALRALSQPFEIERHAINISCSIGIAVYPEHGKDAHALMINADNAMYKAKQAGRSCFGFFNPDT